MIASSLLGAWTAALLLTGPASPAAPLDSIFATVRAGPAGPALAMAVLYRGRVVYRNVAGFADLERRVPATLDTRFDWASIAKQFTAFAVAQLVEQGRLAPSDAVSRYLPELDLGGAEITIDQLLHHTSGLEDTDGLLVLAGGRAGDRVEFDDALRLLLRQRHLRFAPGEQEFYGNGGYTLLAEIVHRVTGVPFADWCDSLIFRPLGMAHSGFPARSDQMVPGRAAAYQRDRDGGALRWGSVDVYPGPGGLYATVDDLLRWSANLLHPVYQPAATRRLRQPGRLASGAELDYAWGLGRGSYRGRATLMHGGSGPATEAQLLLVPELDFAVVVAAAGPTGQNPSALAFMAADLFLAAQLGPRDAPTARRSIFLTTEMMRQRPEESRNVVVPADRLRRLAGTYQFVDEPAMVVRVAGDHLEYSWDGRPPSIPLFPLPDGRFIMVPLWDAYRFEADSGGRITGIVRERTPKSLRTRGPERLRGSRLPEAATLDSASLAPYLGWYYSDELETFYQVALVHGRLELHHPRHGALPLTSLGGDRFGIDSYLVAGAEFARQGGQVTGMELQAYSWSTRAFFRKLTAAP